jgi:hypothetical protein
VIEDNADKLTLPLFPPVMNNAFHIHFHLLEQDLPKVQTKKLIKKVTNKTPDQTL